MRFVLTTDVQEFAERTRDLLTTRIECNIHATVLEGIREARHPSAFFAYGVDERSEVPFAALRTPPWPMLATELEPRLTSGFVERWVAADPEVPGVNALTQTARGIAAAWAAETGGRTVVRLRQAMHALEQLQEPRRPAAGRLRPAYRGERDLLAEWMRAFASEAGIQGGEQAEQMLDAQLAGGRLFVWEVDAPVSMAGTAPRVAGVTRIGPVYTPPEHRRRGYATSLVAALSRAALQSEADRCMLYTDLANPTSNKIYAEVGYRRIADWEEHAFEVASR